MNPVNVLPPAVGEIRGRLENPDESSKGSHANSNEELNPPPIDTNFPEVFSELERQLGMDQEINPEQGDNSQTNSTNSSNSTRFGAIANLNKKLDILGLSATVPDRTVRRPRPAPASGRPTRRKGDSVRDLKINLDETAATLRNDSLDVTVEAIRTRHGLLEERTDQYYFDKAFGDFGNRIRSNVFSDSNRARLLRFSKKVRMEARPAGEIEIAHEITDYTDPLSASYMPQSTMFEQPDSIYRDHLDSNIFHGSERVTLADLEKRINKPKWEILQNLLWLVPQGEVELHQSDPEHFG
jgi:hypothetical protein